MFAESCNFIHNASATINAEALHSNDSTPPQFTAGPSTPHKSLEVIIDSPRSIRSPPRSPRTTSLLLALRDVIGDPDEEEAEQTVIGNQANSAQGDNWSEALPTLVNIETGFRGFSLPEESTATSSDSEEPESDDYEGNWTAISDYDDEEDEENTDSDENQFEDTYLQNGPPDVITPEEDEATVQLSSGGNADADVGRPLSSVSSVSHSQNQNEDFDSSANLIASGLLSPIELSDIQLKPFFPIEPGNSSRDSNSFDSGYGEHWKPPIPLQATPPRSPSVNSTFDLISSPFGAHSGRLLSPRLGAFITRSPVSPARTILSPSIHEEVEALDLSLDSPSTYQPYQHDIDSAGHSFPTEEEMQECDDTHSSTELMELLEGGGDQDDQEEDISPDSYGHTSIWDPEGGPTAVFTGDTPVALDASDASRRLSISSSNSDALSTPESTGRDPEDSESEDDTAFLAYLNSPLAQQTENDTISSFYDIYSDIAPDAASPSSNTIHPAGQIPLQQETPSRSNSSTPASSLRERVFTPPPPPMRKRSGTITAADSPNSLSSPITSLDSMSRGRASPFSISDRNSIARGTGSQSPYGQEVEVSRKISFGFKNSFALGRASRSSLMASRSGRRSAPASPLQAYTQESAQESRYSYTNHSSTSSSKPGLKPLRLLSSARSSNIPLNIRTSTTALNSGSASPSLSAQYFKNLANLEEPRSAPAASWRQSINYSRPSSRLSERFIEDDEDDDTGHFSQNDPYGETIRRPIPIAPHTAPAFYPPTYAIETPKPTLMFAIASDNVDEVRRVLDAGEADPNETVGPQSALMFALTNDKLSNRLDIVKTLLAYGADPTAAKNVAAPHSSSEGQEEEEEGESQASEHLSKTLMDEIDPATRYYLERADAIHTRRISVLIKRSVFKPLTRVRYELIGQDRALEQLFRVLSMHSREVAVTPMVVMLTQWAWKESSGAEIDLGVLISALYQEPTNCTLAEFLINNEGKRCVVVLDEIEKTADQTALWSLLMPWELGRCSFEAGSRHVDVRNVIWLGTSNIGHDLVFQHREARKNPDSESMSREEYVELMALLRPRVSERLGASVLSRITTVLPFVPFSVEEKRAICSEAFYTLGGEFARSLPQERVEGIIANALTSYIADEGARSLSRAISNQLVDII
ncbi:hypothetical protein CVT25_003669 [Psilocybe cyanescens]|uniref:Uncharacterized protein n=1 Tax=Psilocybe cyanescens TaxID=93625 RepID=A0A409WZZ8_PSICY|nr:hypothetical protein CVT25_003669 [Psilocybe cyanescens]